MIPEWIEAGITIEPKGATPAWFKQVHGASVVELTAPTPHSPPPEADAGFTLSTEISPFVFTADCVPVLFFGRDPSAPIGAAHAGWRGAMKGIVAKTRHAMQLSPSDTFVLLGPSIGPCCFEVQDDFIAAFESNGRNITPYLEQRKGSQFCRLLDFIISEDLKDVPREQIDYWQHRCTACSFPELPSFRRNKIANPMLRTWIRKRAL
jgi:polyphenol oxidase